MTRLGTISVGTVLPAGSWDPAREIDRVLADYDGRHRRRLLMRSVGGRELMLDLEAARHLRDGDGLPLPDGRVVRIVAAAEPLLAITAADGLALTQLAWHLGNRHLAAAIERDRILIRADHVIADMVRGLGGTVQPIEAPFDPEGGAYAGQASGPRHHHEDGHGDGHRHAS